MPEMINPLTRFPSDMTFTRFPEWIDELFRESFVLPNRFFRFFDVRRYSNLIETDESYIVQIMLPGVDPETLKIEVVGRHLTVTATIKVPVVEKGVYLFQGLMSQEFTEVFTLPVEVLGDKAVANYEYGVLSITLPKLEYAKPKKIEVHTTK
jgi:HSP20 family protein